MFPLFPTLRRHVSRPVAAGVGADRLSSHPSGVTFLLRASSDAMVDVDSIKGCAVQSETVFHYSARHSNKFSWAEWIAALTLHDGP